MPKIEIKESENQLLQKDKLSYICTTKAGMTEAALFPYLTNADLTRLR